ncbi:hypothetical protein A3A93_00040 [Candidatus Roizmanbacteria bacterium RIFCSPLOWO2_01_FULL_38_12]|uniref:DUF192 domain-containing protein n=1 Tax=Candidatus Roizmanbacteria bacterium RIFCSPLOWO2_01_FULL_38_12 TaxID=1802061 RepID=A0A1F7J0V9_9BACT|nr:MAG: hypothetical protein A2861_00800 [Candidatus Roizmanbacteria bacterium RIFCSPHIGHO2_01_FULL_38_15]OGK49258.1 MAG: hypothetical protein A3A93_00040 [Candidatus Roizmanbacteria bacterium RIFCSPLOWO2_01_FULL_38_12]
MKYFSAKKIIIGILVLILIVVIGFSGKYILSKQCSPVKDERFTNYEIVKVNIENKDMCLLVAGTPEQWIQGLMFVRKPVDNFDGMIFSFPAVEQQTFWNKNIYIDITIYWMKDGKIFSKDKLPSIEKSKNIVTVMSPSAVDTVVEVIE